LLPYLPTLRCNTNILNLIIHLVKMLTCWAWIISPL
jgi:hypothetical protein